MFITNTFGHLREGKYLTVSDIKFLMSEYAKLILTEYTDFLLKEQYCDSDVYSEPPSAIDRFMHPELNK